MPIMNRIRLGYPGGNKMERTTKQTAMRMALLPSSLRAALSPSPLCHKPRSLNGNLRCIIAMQTEE